MHNIPIYPEKYEKALYGMQFLIACCRDDIEEEKQATLPDPTRLCALEERLAELLSVERRLRIGTDRTTLPICEKYGAEIRARIASDAMKANQR